MPLNYQPLYPGEADQGNPYMLVGALPATGAARLRFLAQPPIVE